jgi:hypothetical protein
VLDADPLRRMGPAFGLVRGGEGGRDRQLVLPPSRPRGVSRWGVQFTGGGELHAAGTEVGAGQLLHECAGALVGIDLRRYSTG